MRTVMFDGDAAGARRYALALHGYLMGANTVAHTGLEHMRMRLRILDAFGAASGTPGDPDMWTLKPTGGQLVLTEEEWALLRKLLEAVPWRIERLREALDVINWLGEIPAT